MYAADAHRLEAIPHLAAAHFPQRGREDAAAGCADRVAEGDGGAVRVEPLVLGGQPPQVRMTARACAAKASFSSITPMSASVRPTCPSALSVAAAMNPLECVL